MAIIPNKSLGQHFLIDESVARKIIDCLNLVDNDKVLEIGPGQGALTKYLINQKIPLLCVEIDKNVIKELESKFILNKIKDVKIINEDFLEFDFSKYYQNDGSLKVIGNIPYYISGEIIIKLIRNEEYFESAVIMTQKEVADRLTSLPGKKSYGILTVALSIYFEAKKLFDVFPESFSPAPKVMSSVIELKKVENCNHEINFNEIFELLNAAFQQRRKMLGNSLQPYINKKTGLNKSEFIKYSGLNEEIFQKRAEDLSKYDYFNLYKKLQELILK